MKWNGCVDWSDMSVKCYLLNTIQSWTTIHLVLNNGVESIPCSEWRLSGWAWKKQLRHIWSPEKASGGKDLDSSCAINLFLNLTRRATCQGLDAPPPPVEWVRCYCDGCQPCVWSGFSCVSVYRPSAVQPAGSSVCRLGLMQVVGRWAEGLVNEGSDSGRLH